MKSFLPRLYLLDITKTDLSAFSLFILLNILSAICYYFSTTTIPGPIDAQPLSFFAGLILIYPISTISILLMTAYILDRRRYLLNIILAIALNLYIIILIKKHIVPWIMR